MPAETTLPKSASSIWSLGKPDCSSAAVGCVWLGFIQVEVNGAKKKVKFIDEPNPLVSSHLPKKGEVDKGTHTPRVIEPRSRGGKRLEMKLGIIPVMAAEAS